MDNPGESLAGHPGEPDAPESAPQAPYDAIADWYESWAGEGPGLISAEGLLPERLEDQRVLDVACGTGRLSRELAGRGATVVGVDLSGRLIDKAQAAAAPGPGRIRYLVADITLPHQWWDGQLFDGAVSEMAFQDIADLQGTIAAVTAALRPGGWLLVSMVHPCFPGDRAVGQSGLPSWPPEGGYCAEGWWISPDHHPDGARIRVGSYHRRLSTYVNAFLDAGLVLERMIEPARDLPVLLALSCRKRI
jgi:SAM-dependent methyltransferase